jgi:hypothetical protein
MSERDLDQLLVVYGKNIIVELLARETLKLFTNPEKPLNDEPALDYKSAALLIGELVRLVIKDVLNDKPLKYEDADLNAYLKDQYIKTRKDIEEQIGLSFTKAVREFANQPVEYTCAIKQVPKRDKTKDN